MYKRWVGACTAGVMALILAWQAPGQGPGQSKGKGKGRPPIVEGPTIWLKDGVPDLRGVWNSGWIVDMADGRYAEKTVEVPFTDWDASYGRSARETCRKTIRTCSASRAGCRAHRASPTRCRLSKPTIR